MFRRHQTSKSIGGHAGGRGVSVGNRNGSQALRVSLVSLLLVASVPVGFVVLTDLPKAPVAGTLQIFSDTWTRVRAGVPWRSEPRPLAAADATNGPMTAAPRTPLVVSRSAERGVISVGDRLKITFFESLGVTLDESGTTSDHVVAAVFPRMDLSAEYAVDESGRVNIPKLGEFATAGQTITALQSDLATAFQRAIGRTSDVHVAIAERQPIYVLGTVRNPGSYKYTPGMIVLQVLAAAGGTDLAMGDTSKAIESIRETERLRQAEDRQNRLFVKQARLIAQRDDSDSIIVPASIKSALSQTAPHERLDALLAGAATPLSVERKKYQQQLSLAERQVSIARVEIEAQSMRAGQLNELLARKDDRLHGLEAIAAHGSVSQYKLTDMKVDISELVARQEDLRVAMAQAERRLVEAEMARSKTELDYTLGIEKDLASTQQDIDDCAREIASMQAVTQVLRDGLPQFAVNSASPPGLTITRRVAEGLIVTFVTETTSLLPGDVVQVGAANRSDAHISGIAQNGQPLQN